MSDLSRRAALRGILWAGVLLAAGCASPDPAYYTLAAVPGTPRRGPPRSIELRRVTVAGYLDRADIVRSSADYRVRLGQNERWGEPLGDLISRVLAEDLMQRLPDCTVIAESAALSVETDLVLEVDVQRFDTAADGRVVLVAQAAMRQRRGGGNGSARSLRFEVAPSGPGTGAFAAAMSTALGRLADALAAGVAAGAV